LRHTHPPHFAIFFTWCTFYVPVDDCTSTGLNGRRACERSVLIISTNATRMCAGPAGVSAANTVLPVVVIDGRLV
jgi:hypothetical protein